MAEISLITIANVRSYVDLSVNYNQERFDIYVNAIQKNYLMKLLGQAMYYDLWDNVTDINTIAAPYADLVNGTSYSYGNDTIQYYGLKPWLSYLVMARITREGNAFHSDYGNVQFIDNEQDHLGTIGRRTQHELIDYYMQEAETYKFYIEKFLTDNSSDYTLLLSEDQPPDIRNGIITTTLR